MGSPIAIFYHALFCKDDGEILEPAFEIIQDQMTQLQRSGLLAAATEFYVGINGGKESEVFADSIIPKEALKVYHGLQCHNELRTLMLLQEVMAARKNWLVLYFHSKGATRKAGEKMIANWRRCMMWYLVSNWRLCVEAMEHGFESCGCHWLSGQVDGNQSLWGGNFWWATSDFLNTLPTIEKHPRIPLMGGVDALASRFEAEVWIGTGPRLPRFRDYHPGWPFHCTAG